MPRLRIHLRRIVIAALAATLSASGARAAKLRRDPDQPTILKYGNSPIRLVGYGDYGMLSEASFDYAAYFDALAPHHINMVRVWVNYHWTASLSPFSKSSGKYNLQTRNGTFYQRLHDFVAAADAHGIFVQVCLFDGVQLEQDSDGLRWKRSPYNASEPNNSNGYLLTARRSDFNNTSGPIWDSANAPLIDKVVEKLGNFGNVIYEVANEPDVSDIKIGSDFHQAVVARLREDFKSYTGSRVISVNASIGSSLYNWALGNADVDVLSFHMPSGLAGGALDVWVKQFNGLAKPIIVSNDGHITQQTQGQGGLPPALRQQTTCQIASGVFNTGAEAGHNHFEFLEKGLMGNTWLTPNYEVSANNVDVGVMETLSAFAGTGVGCGCAPSGGILYVDKTHAGYENGSCVFPYRKIEDAVSAAASGWTVMVRGDAYPERVSIHNKAVHIRNYSGPVHIAP